MILIGIDPDTKKSGVAVYDTSDKHLLLYSYSFFELYEHLVDTKGVYPIKNIKIIIEAGWLNKSNWHSKILNSNKKISEKQKIASSSIIGNKTGSNHETGRKIEEMVQYLGFTYELKRPTAKKVDSKYFEKLTGIKKSNQDQRDSAMLVVGY